MLSMAEYTYNNSKHSSTTISPYYENYGYEPRTTSPMKIDFISPVSSMYCHYMAEVHKKLSENLDKARQQMGNYYNKK